MNDIVILIAWLNLQFVVKKVVCLMIKNYSRTLLLPMEHLFVDLFSQNSTYPTFFGFFGKQNEVSLFLKNLFYNQEIWYGL